MDGPIFTSSRIFAAVAIVIAFTAAILALETWKTNSAGYIQIKQAAGSGELTVHSQPGMYWQNFGTVTEYKISDAYDFNSSGDEISVRFNDASTADVSGQIKYRLPTDDAGIIKIHTDFRSDNAVREQLIRQVVAAALKQTASLFSSVEAYSSRRADFITLVNDQIKNGIYATQYQPASGKTVFKTDEKGNPIVSEASAFKRYNVELIQLVINDFKFDEKTAELIQERKKAEQQQVVAQANAAKAAQDALTAEAQGKANVAQAEAEALVKKKTAVIQAEQEKEVAEQRALKAEQEKLAIIAEGQAKAEAARLAVQAGLTPLDKANIDMQTKIGIAKAISETKFPDHLIVVSGGQSGGANPFDAVGLQALYNLSNKIDGDTQEKK